MACVCNGLFYVVCNAYLTSKRTDTCYGYARLVATRSEPYRNAVPTANSILSKNDSFGGTIYEFTLAIR